MMYDRSYIWWFILLALDIGAHWMQMASAYAAGLVTHKTSGEEENFFIRVYYKNRYFMAFIVAC